MRLATQKEKFTHLGAPGDLKNLAKVKLGQPVNLSWKPNYEIRQFDAHRILVPHIEQIYKKLFALDKQIIRHSGILIWGGCYNFRAVRGTEQRDNPPFSTHAWGAAIDTDPERNGLFTRTDKANLAKPEFASIHDIFRVHGFINLGTVKGRDWMHWEASYEVITNPSGYL
jgi:hypothetical protein